MKNHITKEEAQAAIDVWGKETQTNMLIEEVGEFLQAWNKVKRGAFTEEQYVEELVDVYIMIQQMIHMHSEVFAEVYPKKLAKVKDKIATAAEKKNIIETIIERESPELWRQMNDDPADVGC